MLVKRMGGQTDCWSNGWVSNGLLVERERCSPGPVPSLPGPVVKLSGPLTPLPAAGASGAGDVDGDADDDMANLMLAWYYTGPAPAPAPRRATAAARRGASKLRGKGGALARLLAAETRAAHSRVGGRRESDRRGAGARKNTPPLRHGTRPSAHERGRPTCTPRGSRRSAGRLDC